MARPADRRRRRGRPPSWQALDAVTNETLALVLLRVRADPRLAHLRAAAVTAALMGVVQEWAKISGTLPIMWDLAAAMLEMKREEEARDAGSSP